MGFDVARIAFVTRRFRELQGLHQAMFGAGLVFGSLVEASAGQSMLHAPDPSGVMGLATGSMMIALLILEPRYRSSFGNPAASSGATIVALVSSPSVLVLLGMLGDMVSGLRVNGPSGAAMGLAVASMLPLVRDARWRPHYLVPLSAAIVAAIATASVPPGSALYSWERDPQRAPAFIFAYSMVGFGMIVAGILDHRLLVSALGRDRRAEMGTGAVHEKPLTLDFACSAAVVSGGVGIALAMVSPGYLGMALTLVLSICFLFWATVRSFAQFRRGFRQFRRGDGVAPPPAFRISSKGLALLVVMAIGALADVSRPSHPPIALTAAFAACSLAGAMTGWPRRSHYLIGLVASGVVLSVAPGLQPIQSFALLTCVAAATVAFVLVVDSQMERDHADTL